MISTEEVAVVLCSGGSDSTLALCEMVNSGYKVCPLICDGGCLSGVEWAKQRIDEVRNVFGTNIVLPTLTQFTGGAFRDLRYTVFNKTLSEISVKYGHIKPGHAICMMCHSIMVASAVGIARAYGWRDVVDGTRKSEKYIMSSEDMTDRYKKFAVCHKTNLCLPVYDISDVTLALSYYGISVQYAEPQCWVSHPPKDLTPEATKELLQLFDIKTLKYMHTVTKQVKHVNTYLR